MYFDVTSSPCWICPPVPDTEADKSWRGSKPIVKLDREGNGYDYQATRHFKAYLVVTDIYKKPLVVPF